MIRFIERLFWGRKRRNFADAMRRGANKGLKDGVVTQRQRDAIVEGSYNKTTVDRAISQLESHPDRYGAPDWEKIWEWVQTQLVPFLQMLIPLVLMFLDDNEE